MTTGPLNAMQRAIFIRDTKPTAFVCHKTEPGPFPVFSENDYALKMAIQPYCYKGSATNIFHLDISKFSIDTDPVEDAEAQEIGKKKFSLENARKGHFHFARPIPVVVHDKKERGKNLRIYGLDKLIFAFFWEWYEWHQYAHTTYKATPDDKKFMLETFENTAYHCPVDYHYFDVEPDVEMKIYIAAMNHLEGIRKDEEQLAIGGWQACCLTAKARTFAVPTNGGRDTMDVLAEIDWAKTSDFQVKKKRLPARKRLRLPARKRISLTTIKSMSLTRSASTNASTI